MSSEISVTSRTVAGSSEGRLRIRRTGTDFSRVEKQRVVPLIVPIGQAYYWTRAWQESERQAVRDLGEGNSMTFPDMDAAIAFLFSEDE